MGKKKGGKNKAQGVEISWGGADGEGPPATASQPSKPMMYQAKAKAQTTAAVPIDQQDDKLMIFSQVQGGRPRAEQPIEETKLQKRQIADKIQPKPKKQPKDQPQDPTSTISSKPRGLTQLMGKNDPAESEQQIQEQKSKKVKKEKLDLTKVAPYKFKGNTLFEKFMENKDNQQKIMSFYEDNLKSMKTLHHYLQDELVFKKSSDIESRVLDAEIKLNEKLLNSEDELLQQEDFYREFLVNRLQKDIIVDSVIKKQALGTFDKGIDGEMTPLVQAPVEPEDEIGDQEIDDILNGAFDPFEDLDEDPQNLDEQNELNNDFIKKALDMIKEVQAEGKEKKKHLNSVDTNQLVTQARQKRKQINIKVEEEEKKHKMLEIESKIEEQRKKVQEQPQEQASEKSNPKKDEDSSSDEEFKVIMKQKPEASDSLVYQYDNHISAQPSVFNHALEARKQQISMINQLHSKQSESESGSQISQMDLQSQMGAFDIDKVLGDQEQEQKEEVWAIVDDENMDNFDQWYPVADRAIVYPFEMDIFQKRAVHRLEQGACVFVAAHTSAGKTVVAEYAIALSMKHMTKTLYTSPIKALSNQKFRDFKIKFGDDVGILTGDVSINRDATVVIMTTEVLQNQVYNDTDRLQDVEWVIFDEAHYIDDPERGSVWEEVIMKLPDHISIVLLSATFKNYMEFADWVGRTKKKKVYVQCTYQRPVPLEHHLVHKEKMHQVKIGEAKLDKTIVEKILTQSKQDRRQNMSGGGGKGGAGGGGKNKIDYKAKAIAGKEAATQKTIDHAMGGGTSTGGGPNNQKGGQKKFEAFFKNLKAIKSEGLLPCVVFFFSRAQVESLANEVDGNMNFIGDVERKAIKDFKKKALQRLEENDRELPQIVSLSNLLDRGIGFHHAGMVPILKEMVEILFTDGYLKVVFATSTFAIGLNMPARSVIFTQSTKFNGEKNEILSSTEYLQMAGRAGRRGKDDKGASILCVDDNFGKVPGIEDYEEMFDNKGKDVESKLKLTYKTNLNVLNSEDQDIGSLITNSFFSNASEQKKISAVKSKKKLGPRIEKVGTIECHKCKVQDILGYFQLCQSLQKLNVALSQESSLKPILLHVCKILTPKHHMKKGIVLKHTPPTKSLGGKQIPAKYLCVLLEKDEQYKKPLFYEEGETYDSQLAKSANKSAGSQKLQRRGQFQNDGIESGYHFEYTEIGLKDVVTYYSSEIKLDYMLMLNQNTLTQKQLKDIIEAYDWIEQKSGLQKIKAKRGKNIKSILEEREKAFQQLAELECLSCDKLVYHATQCQKQYELEEELRVCNELLSSESNEKENDFIAKNKVLEQYKMIDTDENMLFKGKVAKEAGSGDAILITQLLFSGHLKNLKNEEMLALFSVLVTETKASRSHQMLESKISDKFWAACMYLEEEATKLIEVENKCGVLDQEKDVTKRLNYFFYEIVYDWAKKKPFIDIKTAHMGLEEGIVIKMILNVKNLCKVFKQMSTLIGDVTLASRIDEASELLEREIMKTQSLYFQ